MKKTEQNIFVRAQWVWKEENSGRSSKHLDVVYAFYSMKEDNKMSLSAGLSWLLSIRSDGISIFTIVVVMWFDVIAL